MSSEKIDENLDNTEMKVQSSNLTLAEFLHILKKILLGPILSENTVEERIKDFSVDLGDLLLFLWSILLNIKANIFDFLKSC
tara:strand:- start:1153 stop:1398 length:246 start_codon:yes stop_codon:yes gene_type:complete